MPRGRNALFIAWLCACAGLLLSITFSEARGWTPCFLCWYQRICLWPLVPILGAALQRRWLGVATYVTPQVVVGLLLAAYQVLIQEVVGRDVLGICRAGPDCTKSVGLGLGPITIPMMSLAAFVVVFVMLRRAGSRTGTTLARRRGLG